MTCDACDRAQVNVETGRFNAGCTECTARALAGGPLYHASALADTLTPAYRDALQSLFGANWKHGHERVKHHAALIVAARGAV